MRFYLKGLIILFFIFTFSVKSFAESDSLCDFAFRDIRDVRFCPYINYLYLNDVVSGKDGKFNPEGFVTRGELSKIIAKAFDISGSGDVSFPDIRDDEIFKEYISALEESGIVDGYPDGTFRPANYVKRGVILKFLMNAIDLKKPDAITLKTPSESIFPDVPKDHVFGSYILSAVELGRVIPKIENRIINGYSDGEFKPDRFITRAEVAKIVSNAVLMFDFSKLECSLDYCEELWTGSGVSPYPSFSVYPTVYPSPSVSVSPIASSTPTPEMIPSVSPAATTPVVTGGYGNTDSLWRGEFYPWVPCSTFTSQIRTQFAISCFDSVSWTSSAPYVLESTPKNNSWSTQLGFNWGTNWPLIGVDRHVNGTFSAIWTRKVRFNGTYIFRVAVDDGVRVYIDDSLIIDAWYPQSRSLYPNGQTQWPIVSESIHLQDKVYDVRVEYFQNAYDAWFGLDWEKVSGVL